MKSIVMTNTLGRSKSEFVPISTGRVDIYHCGPTVYWNQHIGNMRAAFVGDIVHRTFLYAGYTVRYVRNYTDVGHLSGDNAGDADSGEDRMEIASRREETTPQAIANKYRTRFETDINLLNMLPPYQTPSATEYITEMIDTVQILLDKGIAYQTPLAIYFDTSQQKDYYKLSLQQADKLYNQAGHGDVQDNDKRNQSDFALWFFAAGVHKNTLQSWENPFSETRGFPGWHIECSAMIHSILGTSIDIHLGGIEHIPIHHTNEIAQSESAFDAPLSQFWLHNELLEIDGGKMSKSAGTSYCLDDLVQRGYDPLDLRFFFLQAHYRSKQNFTWDALDASRTGRMRLAEKVAMLADEIGTASTQYQEQFESALFDDFNTSEGLAIINNVLKSDISNADKKATILDFDKILGLRLGEINELSIPPQVQSLLDERSDARDSHNWAKSDSLRDDIAKLGYVVKDTDNGQQVSKK